MITLTDYCAYKAAEQFLDSLLLAKPMPAFIAPKHTVQPRNPFGLQRVRSFLEAAGNPQRHNRYIHIAGTSGKTSTTYFVANLLQAQGYTTGRFTSPPIGTFAEYFTINQQLPPIRDVLDLIESAKPLIDREYEQTELGMISQAELVLALALTFFARQQVDYVALEAFLGGRHDATNVIEQAEVSILTNIGLDHTHILGNTLTAIATEKLGILKPGTPLVTAEQRPDLLRLFREQARTCGAEVHRLGREFRIEQVAARPEATEFDYVSAAHTFRGLTTGVCGSYQARNAALAIRALELVAEQRGRPLNEAALRQALRLTAISGRAEQVQDAPVVLLDGAHNSDKIAQFAAYLISRFAPRPGVIVVFGCTSGKDPAAMLTPLVEVSDRFYLTRPIIGSREAEEPRYLQSVLRSLRPAGLAITLALDPVAALDQALDEARRRDQVVCVTGSLYLVAHLRQRWYPEATMLRTA